MGLSHIYPYNQPVEVSVEFKNALTNEFFDPDVVKLWVSDPDQTDAASTTFNSIDDSRSISVWR